MDASRVNNIAPTAQPISRMKNYIHVVSARKVGVCAGERSLATPTLRNTVVLVLFVTLLCDADGRGKSKRQVITVTRA